MVNKRLIGVVTVKDGWAVQSSGYSRHLPMGKPECIVENLDRWGADEILVLSIDRSRRGLGPDFQTLERLSQLTLTTPLIYGGGIRSAEDGVAAIRAGADRVCVDALLHDNLPGALQLARQVGAQAVIAAMPLSVETGTLFWRDYRRRQNVPLPEPLLAALRDGALSETMLIDWRHEGHPAAFDASLLDLFPVGDGRLIAFGGLSEPGQIARTLAHKDVTAVGVGNFLSYREHAIQLLKSQTQNLPVRPPHYQALAQSCPEPS